MIGRTLSHYKILQKLGSGGMGDVYLAQDTELDRDVALKVLPPDLASSEERRARFKREAKAVAALNHPHIVTVHSVEESDGVHFITMELVRGKTLSEVIPGKGLSLAKFFEIAIPLTDAVAAAHDKGILHRDLKPDNLMLSDEGRLKILDFGLAKLTPEAGVSGINELPTKSRTEEGRIVGTVAYMSPEQGEGKALDSRSDIFSLGIVLYEMATGKRPFQGETTASVLSSILKDTPRSATELNPALPSLLGRILRRCLVKDPEHRYQTAKDLRNELEELKREVESGEVREGIAPSKAIGAPTSVFLAVGSLIPTYYEALARDVKEGDRILLDDGSLALRVLRVEGTEVFCEVEVGGELKSRKGMNLPGVALSTPSLTEKDRKDARFALDLGVDFLALSFVRRAADVEELKSLVALVAKSGARPSIPSIIAKIERPEALEDIDAILDAADGIMVARGDLGVEMPPRRCL